MHRQVFHCLHTIMRKKYRTKGTFNLSELASQRWSVPLFEGLILGIDHFTVVAQ